MPYLYNTRRLKRGNFEALAWLEKYRWTHLVTLATNDYSCSYPPRRMEKSYRHWRAQLNRKMAGSLWGKHPDERLFAIAFLEKPVSNPHWHCLVMLDSPSSPKRPIQEKVLMEVAPGLWERIVPSGTVDVQWIFDLPGAVKYVAKELGFGVQFQHFILPE